MLKPILLCAALSGALSACGEAIKPNVSPIREGLGQIEYLSAERNFVQYTEASFQNLTGATPLPGDLLDRINQQVLRELTLSKPTAKGGKNLAVSGQITAYDTSGLYYTLTGELVLRDAASGQAVGRATVIGKSHNEQPPAAVIEDFAKGVGQLLGWR
jgi:hypothetical protein